MSQSSSKRTTLRKERDEEIRSVSNRHGHGHGNGNGNHGDNDNDNDDGMESFGIFSSIQMLDNADLRSKKSRKSGASSSSFSGSRTKRGLGTSRGIKKLAQKMKVRGGRGVKHASATASASTSASASAPTNMKNHRISRIVGVGVGGSGSGSASGSHSERKRKVMNTKTKSLFQPVPVPVPTPVASKKCASSRTQHSNNARNFNCHDDVKCRSIASLAKATSTKSQSIPIQIPIPIYVPPSTTKSRMISSSQKTNNSSTISTVDKMNENENENDSCLISSSSSSRRINANASVRARARAISKPKPKQTGIHSFFTASGSKIATASATSTTTTKTTTTTTTNTKESTRSTNTITPRKVGNRVEKKQIGGDTNGNDNTGIRRVSPFPQSKRNTKNKNKPDSNENEHKITSTSASVKHDPTDAEVEVEVEDEISSSTSSSEGTNNEQKSDVNVVAVQTKILDSVLNPTELEEHRRMVEEKKHRKLNAQTFGSHNLFHAPAIPPSDVQLRSYTRIDKVTPKVEKSLLWKLCYQRPHCSTATRNRCIDGGYHSLSSYLHNKWEESRHVQLHVAGSAASPPHGSGHDITCMEFDAEGVLLAVGDTAGYIRIYDFDEVNAADMVMRRGVGSKTASRKGMGGMGMAMASINANNGQQQPCRIAPFISFNTRSPGISSITWDPNNDDMLAVTFSSDSEVRIYDLAALPEGSRDESFIQLKDKSRKAALQGHCNVTFKFLSNEYVKVKSKSKNECRALVGGDDGSLRLWKFGKGIKHGRLIWSINPWQTGGAGTTTCGAISDIQHLSRTNVGKEKSTGMSGLVLLSTTTGSFALIDMNKCTRKSFAANPTPQVLKTWNLRQLRALKNHCNQLPGGKYLGVAKCFVQSEIVTQSQNKNVEVLIVTNGGWVISQRFDVKNGAVMSMSASILHSSPGIKQFDTEGNELDNEIQIGTTPSSTPTFSSVAGSLNASNSLIVLTDVEAIRQVLPSKDKRVLDMQSIVSRKSSPDGLMVMNLKGGHQIRIPNQEIVKHLAVHPDNQWMVVRSAKDTNRNHLKLLCVS